MKEDDRKKANEVLKECAGQEITCPQALDKLISIIWNQEEAVNQALTALEGEVGAMSQFYIEGEEGFSDGYYVNKRGVLALLRKAKEGK